MENQKLMDELGKFEQEMKYLQEQMNSVENGIVELSSLNLDLDSIKGKKGNEILASIGRGIYIPSKILSEKLIVNVGEKHLVEKNIDDTKDIISQQIEKLKDVQSEIQTNLDKLNSDMTKTFEKYN